MKKLLFLLLISCIYTSSFSQDIRKYTFTSTTQNYNNLNGETSIIPQNYLWDDGFGVRPIGFTFYIRNRPFTNVGINLDGYLMFDDSIANKRYFVAALGNVDLKDRNINVNTSNQGQTFSPVSYKVDSISTGKIFKVQYKNVRVTDGNSTSDEYANFQIWIYENSNVIEYRFGENSLSGYSSAYLQSKSIFSNSPGLLSGIIRDGLPSGGVNAYQGLPTTSWVNGLALKNSPVNPDTLHLNNYLNNENLITTFPAENVVYRFVPSSVTYTNQLNGLHLDFKILENPVSSELRLEYYSEEVGKIKYEIIDVNGKILMSNFVECNSGLNQISIDISTFPSSTYFCRLSNEKFQGTKQVLKIN